MINYKVTRNIVCNYILWWQGLVGEKKYIGKDGVLQYIRHIGCIQYDPVDICGKNADIVLQSRVVEYSKNMLEELLYEQKQLIDCYDKNLSIIPSSNWKYFQYAKKNFKEYYKNMKNTELIINDINEKIKRKKYVCSKDIESEYKTDWGWGDTKISRVVLELMHREGELVVHHKIGNIKYYAYAKDYLSNETFDSQNAFFSREEYLEWRVYMRIVAVGALWNRGSDAWIGIDMNANERDNAIYNLLQNNKIVEIHLSDEKFPLYIPEEAEATFVQIVNGNKNVAARMEFIAPLDSILWDRKLIEMLFDFNYKWEIYTPSLKRQYGPYILPILYNDGFIGRIELIHNKEEKSLFIKNIWMEKDVEIDSRIKENYCDCISRFMKFNKCTQINGLTNLA
ncbi:DNA glycosylase AlkZ-like family protein [Clostridium oryzae]|uniref:Winged helix DNA-binding domain-containing protein n=1 Tax=Clostridium oryzae TaxID=1450648 RepID=A0A1V4ID60_9CLOT|nr:crosslink repair DNA glycosylase YcaQ family protein [Clostridium oryzae]OPJ57447.1 hypothetical protein CLORY_40960 [Clostridium oryzae]